MQETGGHRWQGGEDPIVITPYDSSWPEQFRSLATRIRAALRRNAHRIDHIGSTSVPGLAAKPVIDLQISISSLHQTELFVPQLEAIGWTWRRDNPDLTKRYFRERPGEARTHIHVRKLGSFSEQFALLFRDYLRAHPDRCAEYAALKQELALRYSTDRTGYTDAKGPFIWSVLCEASEWSQATGWEPAESDA